MASANRSIHTTQARSWFDISEDNNVDEETSEISLEDIYDEIMGNEYANSGEGEDETGRACGEEDEEALLTSYMKSEYPDDYQYEDVERIYGEGQMSIEREYGADNQTASAKEAATAAVADEDDNWETVESESAKKKAKKDQAAKLATRKLERRTSDNRHIERRARLLFKKIEESEDENVVSIVIDECAKIGVDVRVEDIVFAKRVGPQGAGHLEREIMVGFATTEKRDEILNTLISLLRKERKEKEDKLDRTSLLPTIKPCLQPGTMYLFQRAREERDLGRLASCFLKDSQVMVRRSSDSPPRVINSEHDLEDNLKW